MRQSIVAATSAATTSIVTASAPALSIPLIIQTPL
jgi:hypothetical protein